MLLAHVTAWRGVAGVSRRWRALCSLCLLVLVLSNVVMGVLEKYSVMRPLGVGFSRG